MLIRPAAPEDADAVAAIYAHHVAHGTATFDTVAPPPAHFAAKMAAAPVFLIAEEDGAVIGYAYAAQFRDRPAYAGTARTASTSTPTVAARASAARCSTRWSRRRPRMASARCWR